MQKRRPHPRRIGDERLFLIRLLDLHDRRRGHARVFRPDHMQPRKSRFAAGAKINHLRALDETPRLEIKTLLAVLERQFNSVTNERLALQ